MAELTMSPPAADRRTRRRSLLALGVGLLVLGLAGAGATTLLSLTSLLIFGPLLLVSSLIQFLTAFLAVTGPGRFLLYVAAGLEMVLGFVIMAQPDLVLVIAAFLMVIGFVRLARVLPDNLRGAPGRCWRGAPP